MKRRIAAVVLILCLLLPALAACDGRKACAAGPVPMPAPVVPIVPRPAPVIPVRPVAPAPRPAAPSVTGPRVVPAPMPIPFPIFLGGGSC